jgi:sugar phosphate isomerase/epimerase
MVSPPDPRASGRMAGEPPPFTVSASSTWHSTFAEDMASYSAAGVGGIGLWEFKLPDDDEASIAALAERGLSLSVCWPRVPGPLPSSPLFPGPPSDPAGRTRALCQSIRRLAKFNPLAVAVLGEGDMVGDSVAQVRATVVSSLREAALVAGEVGVQLAMEVIRPGPGANLTTTISDALELVHDVDVDSIGIFIDTWHFWDSPVAPEQIRSYGDAIIAVQVNDYCEDSRGWFDRGLPGTGEMPLPQIVSSLERSGFVGPYELEIFSDDGPLGIRDDSSPAVAGAASVLRKARRGFADVWRVSHHAGEWI